MLSADISEGYLVLLVESATKQILVYDLANIYSPILINRFANPEGIELHDVHSVGDTLVGSQLGGIYRAHARGANIERFALPPEITAVAFDDKGVYLLTDFELRYRGYNNLTQDQVTYLHTVVGAEQLLINGQRLIIRADTEFELLNTFWLKRDDARAFVGKAFVDNSADPAIQR